MTIAGNLLVALAGRFFGYTCHFFALLLIARGLGTEQFGIYGFAMELTFLLSIPSDAGLSIITIREIAVKKKGAASYIGSVLALHLLLSVLAMFLIALCAYLLSWNAAMRPAILLLGFANIMFFLGNFATAIFRAYERLALEGILIALQGLILLSFFLIVTYFTDQASNLDVVLLGPISSSTLMVVGGYGLVCHFLVKPQLRIQRVLWKFLLREGFPIVIALLLLRGYKTVSILSLGQLRSPVDVGVFNAAFRLIDTLQVVAMLLGAAFLPVFSRLAQTSDNSFRNMCGKAFRILFLTGLPMAIGLTMVATEIVLVLFGKGYTAAVLSLQILTWSMLCYFFSYMLKTIFESIGQQWIWTLVLSLGLAVAILLNPLLVGWGGPTGASLATLLVDVTILSVSILFARPNIVFADFRTSFRKIVVSGLVMAMAIHVLRPLGLLIIIPVASLVYGLGLLVLGELEEERNYLRRMFLKIMRSKDLPG